MTNNTITLITGANRGMGREMAIELAQAGQYVLIGARKLEAGEKLAAELRQAGYLANSIQLDVTDESSVKAAAAKIQAEFGKLDILINNAGIVLDNFAKPSKLSLELIRQDFEVNYFGLISVTQAMLPLLRLAPQAKIINMSSRMGSLTAATDPNSRVYQASAVGYQSSKAAMNMYSVKLAKELLDEGGKITVNLIDPGMVATEFGTGDAELAKAHGALPVEAGVARAVALALDKENNVTASFSDTKGEVEW